MDVRYYPVLDFKILRAEAGKGDTEAQFELGLRYYEGRDCPRKNQPLGVEWMSKAADSGHEKAITKLLEIGKKRPLYRYLLDKYLSKSKDSGIAVSEDVLKFSGDKETCIKIVKESLEKDKPDTAKAIYWTNKSDLDYKEIIDITVELINKKFAEKITTKQRIRYERALAQYIFKTGCESYELAVSFIQGHGLPVCKTLGAYLLLKIYNASSSKTEDPDLLMSLCYCYIKGIGISKNKKTAALLYVIAGRPSKLIAFRIESQDKGIAYKKPSGRIWNYYVVSHWIVQKIKNPVKKATTTTVKTSTSFVSVIIATILGVVFMGPTALVFVWLMESDYKLREETMYNYEQEEILRGNAVGSAMILLFFQLAWAYLVVLGCIACFSHYVIELTWESSFTWGFWLAIPVGFMIFWWCVSYLSNVTQNLK